MKIFVTICYYASCFLLFFSSFNNINNVVVDGAVSQGEQARYLATFDQIMEASYSQVDDMSSENINKPPQELLNQCKNSGKTNPTQEVYVNGGSTSVVSSLSVQEQCGVNTICIIPEGITLIMDGNLNVDALIIRGNLEWNDASQSESDLFLCGGYVVVENNGSFEMVLSNSGSNKKGWIYIKNNGAVHPELRSRAFGTFKERYNQDQNPIMLVRGRQDLKRTWSLLSEPLYKDDTQIKLMHSPTEMGWNVGDRIGISPTDGQAVGWGQDVYITDISNDGEVITINTPIENDLRADFEIGNSQYVEGAPPSLISAEVINLSRNIIITGDDFEEVACDPSLPEAVNGEQTSVLGCRCAEFRSTCTVGLHTMHKFGGGDDGIIQIENVRVERCGQRGIEGKYCMHFHKMDDCPNCIFKGNAIENSQQRGIIIHSTHNTLVEDNVLYNVRGANIYLEDGNEMWNTLKYNVAICPFPFRDNTYHGCTIPGTSNRIADTSDNQSGFFSRAGSNNFIGNRASNHFNGMFLAEGSTGRGESYNKVCESASRLGRMDGNTWHSNGRFGTYTLGFNYPKVTDQSILNHGHNGNTDQCKPFDSDGNTQGLSGAFVNHLDYGNAFVGHYSAGDLSHYGHQSIDNNNLIYWKETKTFANGCGSHLKNGFYKKGNMLLPDQATFIIDNVVIGDDTMMEANHHCNVGTTGVLCMPTYILHKVKWENSYSKGNRGNRPWMSFQKKSFQPHNSDQNHGGIFTLSPDDASIVLAGGTVDGSVFPQGFIALVSYKFQYLLGLPNNLCIDTSAQEEYGILYDNGIMCKTELRALKVYTRGLFSGTAPQLNVEIWYNSGGIIDGSPADSSQLIGFHQIGSDGSSKKQGYSVPVIPGKDHSYRISLTTGDIPTDWVIEFSDPVIGNRWSKDELYLTVAGRNCDNNGLITSQHDRKFIWGGDLFSGYLDDQAWSNHGACVGSGQQPPDESSVDCSVIRDTNNNNSNNNNVEAFGAVEATSCPEKCSGECSTNSYCDCGLETCECKAGYTGPNCEIDLCSDADCGEHGSCSARYLGGDMPVTNKACVCGDTWLGERCDKNPCAGIDCSGNGKCIAVNENEAMCECQDGYLGGMCEDRSACEGYCEKGNFPYFDCGSDISGMVALGCFKTGGCYYLREGQDYPYDGFCTYKTYNSEILLPTSTSPVQPVSSPTSSPVVVVPNPVQAPTSPTHSPVSVPTSTNPPTVRCGCNKCTEDVWNALAGEYSCGDRISFLEASDEATLLNMGINTGPLNEEGACRFVTEEFPNICTCICDDDDPTPVPIPIPVPDDPTFAPTKTPVASTFRCGCNKCTEDIWNTFATNDGGSYTCGNRISFLEESDDATLISVGITTGPMNEEESCQFVSDEFPDICTCTCDKDEELIVSLQDNCDDGDTKNKCNTIEGCSWFKNSCQEALPSNSFEPTTSPSKTPSSEPTLSPTQPTTSPTTSPSRSPTTSPTNSPSSLPSTKSENDFNCGCSSCTDAILDNDANGYSCGSRIEWLQTLDSTIVGGPYDNLDSCRKVGEEFPKECGQFCYPEECQPITSFDNVFCGCSSCTDEVWNEDANGYSCGSRIEWLQTLDASRVGGPYNEQESCRKVSEEFPVVCGRCHSDYCSSNIFVRNLRGNSTSI